MTSTRQLYLTLFTRLRRMGVVPYIPHIHHSVTLDKIPTLHSLDSSTAAHWGQHVYYY